MRRISVLFALPALFVLALSACDTVTDLNTVSVEGEWKSAGAIQGMTLIFGPESNGTFDGTWRQGNAQSIVTGGVNENGTIRFTLVGYQGGASEFVGQLTDAFRLEGSLNGAQIDGAAIFRRASF